MNYISEKELKEIKSIDKQINYINTHIDTYNEIIKELECKAKELKNKKDEINNRTKIELPDFIITTEKGVPDYFNPKHFKLEKVKEELKKKNITNPDYYKTGSIECWDAMKAFMTEEEFKGYLKGAAFKYIWRAGKKDSEEDDLTKAINYLEKLKENIKK